MTNLYERIENGEFNHALKFGTSPRERKAWREESRALKEKFKAALLETYDLTGHPKANVFWEICWEEGHAGGWHEINNCASELVRLLQ